MNLRPRVEANRRIAISEGWQMAASPPGADAAGSAAFRWISATVPGTAAGTLREAGEWDIDAVRAFDDEDFWWRTRVRGESGAVLLGFDGLATLADVWLDGERILTSDNMFVAHEVAVTLGGDHELLIRCRALAPELARKRPRARWRVPMLEHQQLRWIRTTLLGRTPGWSPRCPPVGPWRGVWLERRALQVGAVELHASLRRDAAGDVGSVRVALALDTRVERAVLVVEREGVRILAPMVRSDGRWQAIAQVAAPALWWPHTHGSPARYDVSLELTHDGRESRVDLGNTGFRTLEVDRGDGDDFRLRVNGVALFCRGACWTPLDVVTLGASAQAVRAAVVQVRDAGMNMLRVSGTMVYEDDAFHDALDELGILLWQDLMFANMDYPEDAEFSRSVLHEVDQQLGRLQGRPSLAIICGNSEGEQQAAMSGAARERWTPPLFNETLARRALGIGAIYTPSSTHGGAFPHAANAGPSSYYGVGAYLRPLDDARRAEVRFASECLAFANIPFDAGLPGGAALRVHHATWKARAPRDLGAGWDFDDVRDHYLHRLYGVNPAELRATDHDRYLALGRAVSGEVMAQAFAEWRRARSPTGGALIWFLRDLWPGAGWGVIDSGGAAKPCLHRLRHALAPISIALTDEGVNGLAIHVCNDPATPLDARVEIDLYRAGSIRVGHAALDVAVPAHGAIEIAAASLFDGFFDLSYAYRFGPPMADVVRARLVRGEQEALAQAFWFPAGLSAQRVLDVGLSAVASAGATGDELIVEVGTRDFAQSVVVDLKGFVADDAYFHLAPGDKRTLTLRATGSRRSGRLHGSVYALNAESGSRFEVP